MPVRGRASQEGARIGRIARPAPRAVVGAVLVVTAVGGVLVAHRAASAPPTTRYVVAARAVPVGRVLHAEDLGLLAMDLPDGLTAVEESRAQELVGRVVSSDLSELDLVRPSDLSDGPVTEPGAVEVAVELDPSRTPSDLRPGAVVTVLGTDPSGGTEVLARGCMVTAVDDEIDGGIGASDGVRLRLAARDEIEAAALVDAAVAAELTVVVPTEPVGVDDG